MQCTTPNPENGLKTTEKFAKKVSYDARSTSWSESEVNDLLDRILELKKLINSEIDKVDKLTDMLERLTWKVVKPNKNTLKSINEVIANSKDYQRLVRKKFTTVFGRIKTNLCEEERNNLFEALDDLKECLDDIEDIYFIFPSDPEFKKTTEDLESI